MKKIGLIFSFCAIACFGFSQVKVVAPNGHTGIGPAFTTGGQTPAQKLHVDGNALIENSGGYTGLFVRNATGAAQMRFRATLADFVFDDVAGNQQASLGYNGNVNRVNFTSFVGSDVSFETNNNFLWYGSDGKLGIGTTAPALKLHVVGSAGKTDGSSAWTVLSDKRLKSNVKGYEGGLEEVLQINPVVFNYNGKFGTKSDKEVVGVIAQEIQKIAPYMVEETELVEQDIDDAGYKQVVEQGNFLTYNASALPYMLVNAVKEQQDVIETLQEQIDELKNFIADGATINVQEVDINRTATVSQNRPNPFNGTTFIDYYVPSGASNATMHIIDVKGNMIEKITLQGTGNGTVKINVNDLPAGSYSYQLVVDNKVIDSKMMSIAK